MVTELQTLNPDSLDVKQRLWYYPFGMHMEGIGQTMATPAQAYRYNGKELDEATELYDYGARYYDPTIGRWGQVDPLAEKFAYESPYCYVGNDPIRNVDIGGKYKLPADFIQRYTNISRYIQNNVNQDVMNSSIILAAFSRNTAGDSPDGVGNLTPEAVDYATTYGNGPLVIADPDPGGVDDGNGFYSEKTNTIELNTSNLEAMEAILAGDASVEEKQKALYKISSTLLHETVHYGDYLDGVKQDTQEPGVTFEREVWGIRWDGYEEGVDNPAQRYYHHTEKFTRPDLTDQLFEFFNKDEKLRATLPTLPNQ